MIRPFARGLSAALVALALVLVVASPAQAVPLDGSRSMARMGSNFLDGALNWLNGLLTGKALFIPRLATPRNTPPRGRDSNEPVVRAKTGACIDPQGVPTPCTTDPNP